MRQRIYFSLLNEHIFHLSSLIGAFGSGGLLIAIGNYNKLIAMCKSGGRIRNVALKEPYSTLSHPHNTITAQSALIYSHSCCFSVEHKRRYCVECLSCSFPKPQTTKMGFCLVFSTNIKTFLNEDTSKMILR